ncbi:NfeD family protein [Desulfurispira natronophila]|uniref:Membrane-bound serine protease (ClpP class) n=1 Tax=Desulfurispira natronophila TaxID=682562 RepID=A0A7W8DGN2_9BACT|nr:nodulation protein NfeD [Desulfurispira natronophila]MBB5021554.1 membrane-bound serine protease (ClpP class) [Desulfurispira natronophila]
MSPFLMRPRLLLSVLLIVLGTALLMMSSMQARGESANPVAVVIDLEGPIGPAIGDYVKSSLQTAAERNASAAIIRLNTPGGLDSSMRDIIQAILDSPVPVISYVTPTGARAASAGTYILYASSVSAMAPSTNLGAATPVQVQGGGPLGSGDEEKEKQKQSDEEDVKENEKPGETVSSSDAMTRKLVNDAVAYIRGLAELHGRNADWAEKSVREGASITSSDALEKNVIDLIADDIPQLLAAVDGKTVKVQGKEFRLQTANATLEYLEPNWRTKFLATITHPNVVYVLMLVGIYGIIFELANPGSFVPGTIGTISLLLAMYAFQMLPVSYVGIALIAFGIGLMVAEAFVPSFGILGIGGATAFVFGSILLFDTDVAPGYAVSPALIGAFAIFSGLLLSLVLAMVLKARKTKVVSGQEEMIGSIGTVRKDFIEGKGNIWVHSEQWRARSSAPLRQGQAVRVTDIDGLTLEVEPLEDEATTPSHEAATL